VFTVPKQYLTPEHYREVDWNVDTRSEYFRGGACDFPEQGYKSATMRDSLSNKSFDRSRVSQLLKLRPFLRTRPGQLRR
jgi:hypothetical protein